ncbi:hypothetical protein TVAG_183830 [Trichomonas vaginalis G3]|uniref:Uncharacterized protein n=1 Tax=Trichomonas vaginalis (strain ATCC PRA-98 / G3) TaxID=412133 RepID=A2D9C0_TRIV3|nr:hypothetical protein TVAGG3_0770360 [Trichomonas vaginalis G3]EAY23146.1 hypothetical protein TVAG_183830 [Trichomonas vaginalis G3]KAI5513787.1 hypothetical protein TVAGG3_0770360 [Trichomonas vaginalis G3]|eukprot:XP_001584132.1 hypothetical protein [Trichomonas vaginalis G3]
MMYSYNPSLTQRITLEAMYESFIKSFKDDHDAKEKLEKLQEFINAISTPGTKKNKATYDQKRKREYLGDFDINNSKSYSYIKQLLGENPKMLNVKPIIQLMDKYYKDHSKDENPQFIKCPNSKAREAQRDLKSACKYFDENFDLFEFYMKENYFIETIYTKVDND